MVSLGTLLWQVVKSSVREEPSGILKNYDENTIAMSNDIDLLTRICKSHNVSIIALYDEKESSNENNRD